MGWSPWLAVAPDLVSQTHHKQKEELLDALNLSANFLGKVLSQ